MRARALARLIAVVAVVGAIGTGCSTPKTAAPPASAPVVLQAEGGTALVVEESQSGAQIVLQPAQPLQVELTSDGGSVSGGLEWLLVATDPALLAADAPRFERAGRDVNAFESAGTTIWRFLPRAPGRVTLEFALRRPRTLDAPFRTARFEVTVR